MRLKVFLCLFITGICIISGCKKDNNEACEERLSLFYVSPGPEPMGSYDYVIESAVIENGCLKINFEGSACSEISSIALYLRGTHLDGGLPEVDVKLYYSPDGSCDNAIRKSGSFDLISLEELKIGRPIKINLYGWTGDLKYY